MRVCLYKIQNVCASSWITRETDKNGMTETIIPSWQVQTPRAETDRE